MSIMGSYTFGWVNYAGYFQNTETLQVYKIRPHYKWFPFIWYDLWRCEQTTHMTGIEFAERELIAERQKKIVITGMKKLLTND